MTDDKLLLYKISKSVSNDVVVSQHDLNEYTNLNQNNAVSESAIELYLRAYSLKQDERFVEAFRLFENALSSAEGDVEIILDCQYELTSFGSIIERLALNNIYDKRIGSLYEILIKKSEMSMYIHGFAALHYLKSGEKEKAEILLNKLNAVAPNLRILKNIKNETKGA